MTGAPPAGAANEGPRQGAPAGGLHEGASAGEPSGRRDFDVFRLRLGHTIAFLAALSLLFIMAGDWYSTQEGVSAREIERRGGSELPGAGFIDQSAVDDAKLHAEKSERNAWQISSLLDALVLVSLLATVALAIAAAALRAAGRTFDPRRSPSALAAGAAIVAFVLVLAQAVARLDLDSSVLMQVGLPLGVMALGAIAVGSRMAVRDAISEGESSSATPATEAGGPGSVAEREVAPGATYNRAS